MNTLKLFSEQVEDVEYITEEKEGGDKNYKIRGVFMQADVKNRNGRVYPMEVLEKEVGKYNKNFVNEKSKEKILMNSDLFIMPSYKVENSIEGFGISYIEAAKFSVPSISGVDGGVLDAVINNETGWNVNTLNEKELENVIFEAINNQTKRNQLGKNARQSFIKKFASDKVFRKFMAAISNSS